MTTKKRQEAELSKKGRTPFWIRSTAQGAVAFEEKALAIFQPDTLVSVQYQATYQRRFHLDAERSLMLAVLEDAILCFQDNFRAICRRKRSLYNDAEEWIFSNDRSYLFSFENICDALGMDPAFIRQGLIRWKQARQQQTEEGENNRKWAS